MKKVNIDRDNAGLYCLVSSLNANEVVTAVSNLMLEGWQPLGSIALAGTTEWVEYAQAMVRKP